MLQSGGKVIILRWALRRKRTSLSGCSKAIFSSVMASYIRRNDWTMLLKTTGFHSSFSFLLNPVA